MAMIQILNLHPIKAQPALFLIFETITMSNLKGIIRPLDHWFDKTIENKKENKKRTDISQLDQLRSTSAGMPFSKAGMSSE